MRIGYARIGPEMLTVTLALCNMLRCVIFVSIYALHRSTSFVTHDCNVRRLQHSNFAASLLRSVLTSYCKVVSYVSNTLINILMILSQPSMLSQHIEATSRYLCVCSTYNNGLPHEVSSATLYRHLDEATTEEEKHRIRSAKALGAIALSLNDPPIPQSTDTNIPIPRGARRADTLRGLAQRARESEGSNGRAGRRKRAKIESIDDDNIVRILSQCYRDNIEVTNDYI